eukprot:m.1202984 g.1202984  ORF g.1202984 m.1202984 type:complete len:291 (-) comp24577_c0_seq29:1219-2091(-)
MYHVRPRLFWRLTASRGSGKQKKSAKSSLAMSVQWDDHCWICTHKGDLICCDSCPRVFHRKCLVKQAKDWHLPDNEFVSHVDDEAVEFHCIECIHSARDTACVMTGFRGDDDAKLIPCVSCPRVFDASLAAHPARDANADAASGDPPPDLSCYPESIAFDRRHMHWQCTRCAAGNAARRAAVQTPQGETHTSPCTSGADEEAAVLSQVSQLLRRLPTHHWGSVLGSRIHSYLGVERQLADDAPILCAGRLQHGNVQLLQRRQHFLYGGAGMKSSGFPWCRSLYRTALCCI